MRSGVRGYQIRGTRPGYEGISAGVRGYKCRDTRVLVPGSGYEGISVPGYAGILVPGYEGISAGVRGY